ncbi:MAG: bile acid:sodium symporter [Candidatus Caenarcaniphilales bacterium]|nr:bile acid:sodium symporter [Candidatus Caenarcaniphilales bacterium]
MYSSFFLLLLFVVHLIAFLLPAFGQSMREVHLGKVLWIDGSSLKITIPVIMLSFLLFNAGIGIKPSQFKNLMQKPIILFTGLVANLSVPILFTICLIPFTKFWHNPAEVQNLLLGLALIGSMPIAGSSTAWAQNSNGNLALSLGLVVFSTILSPITTPLALHSFGLMTVGDYSHDLHEIARKGVGAFLSFSVVLPSALGIFFHFILGEKKVELTKPYLKFFNYTNLLLLIYSNASVALPKAFNNPDWDFLIIILLITISLCLLAFTAGWAIAKIFKVSNADKASLMFGLGMNNNGTGLVLSSLTLADHPLVMIPIIFYNLIQQIVAGLIDSKMSWMENDKTKNF